jgi:hypothetical protein
MPPADKLYWAIIPDEPAMANYRQLTDGEYTLGILDTYPRADRAPGAAKGEWLHTTVVHVLQYDTGPKTTRLPALGLADGEGGVVAVLSVNPSLWMWLAGKPLPPFVEGEIRLDFPDLPDDPPWWY